ncbi:DUF4214 domain-containing protein [Burkholderia guangdongensis]|uniref:DUF4214 domain-containing protein n=1 Tax=Burkholderia guangdongensis TaxID=1792500 RepID=UPI0015C99AEF|nr:DUF4214 domain-containing protein [Burkholderia guangdongensis]
MAAAQYNELIQEAYIAYYGRPADPAGLAYWAQQLANANGNLNVIINAFGNSAESQALYGGSNTAAQVNAIYETLFGRQADTAGLNYYVQGITQGQFTLASVALNIYNGAQGADATLLADKLAYADAFTAGVSQSTSAQIAYNGTIAANNARAALGAVTDPGSEQTALTNLPTTLSNIGVDNSQTYTLTAATSSVNEGAHDLITLHTTGVAAGTVLTYNITGIDATRLTSGTGTGQVTVDANGNATIDLGVVANNHTDGPTTANVALANGKAAVNVVVNDTSVTPVPTYTLTATTDSVNEGSNDLITLHTTNVAAGTVLTYNITGIDAARLTSGTATGQVTVDANGNATINLGVIANNHTDGPTTANVALANGQAAVNVVVNDTSLTPVVPVPTYTLTAATDSVNEGAHDLITLHTTNVAAGTVLTYNITGIDATRLTSGTGTGQVTVDANGNATIDLGVIANNHTDGPTTANVALANGQAAVNVVVNDTSVTPVPTYTLTAATSSVNEGSDDLITLHTTNVAAGTVLTYNITGIDAARLTSGTATGQVTVDANGNATIDLGVIANNHTDGPTTAVVSLANGQAAVDVVVNDTSLTPPQVLTTGTDTIAAQAADMTILGQVGDGGNGTDNVSTLNSSDIIHGNSSDLNVLKVTATGYTPSVNGFSMDGVQTLEVDSFTSGEGNGVTLGLVNVQGLQHVVSTNSTGNITLDAIQNNVDLTLNGTGGTASGGVDVTLQYSAGAVAADATQAIALNGFGGNIIVGDVNGNGISEVDVTTTGSASNITLASNDLATLKIAGTADLSLATNSSLLGTVDASTFNNNLTLAAQLAGDSTVTVGNGANELNLDVYGGTSGGAVPTGPAPAMPVSASGATTINVGNGANIVNITEHTGDALLGSHNGPHEASITVNAGSGANQINVIGLEGGFTDVTVNASGGGNTIDVGVQSNWSGGGDWAHTAHNVNITTLGGNNTIDVANANVVAINTGTGTGTNNIDVGNTYSVAIGTGDGTNNIDVGNANSVAISTGDGTNTVDVGNVVTNAIIAGGAGNDTVTIGNVTGTLVALLGNGENSLTTGTVHTARVSDVGGSDGGGDGDNTITIGGLTANAALTVSLGNGNNNVTLNNASSGGSNISISAGDGTNSVDLSGFTGYAAGVLPADQLTVQLGNGANTVTLGESGLEYGNTNTAASNTYTITAGTSGENTLVAPTFDHLMGAGDFSTVSNFQTLEITGHANGSFDGITTGANTTGIVNYVLDGQINGNLALTNVVNNVTVDVNGGTDRVWGWGHAVDLSIAQPAVGTATVANVNFNVGEGTTSTYGSHGANTHVSFENVGTLNLDASYVPVDSDLSGASTVNLRSVIAHDTTTLNISGNANVNISTAYNNNDIAKLSTINASTETGNLTLDLSDANHPAVGGITITTGTGSNDITTGIGAVTIDASASNVDNWFYVESGGGDITVTAGGVADANGVSGSSDYANLWTDVGNINVHMGDGNNSISADAVNGTTSITLGNGNNTVTSTALGGTSITLENGNNTVTSETLNGTTSITLGNGTNTVNANTFNGDDSSGNVTVTAGNGVNVVTTGVNVGSGVHAVNTTDTITLGLDHEVTTWDINGNRSTVVTTGNNGGTDGNDTVHSYSHNSVITTGSGNDTIYVQNDGITEVHAGAGDDTIIIGYGNELTAADILDGGSGNNTVIMESGGISGTGSLGTQDDSLFRHWFGIQNLHLADGHNDLTLGWIAQNDAGLQSVWLSDNGTGATGAGDTLRFNNDFTGSINVHLSNGADTIESSTINPVTYGGPAAVSVYANDSQVTSADILNLNGFNGTNTLFVTATGYAADLTALQGGFENVNVVAGTQGFGTTLSLGADGSIVNGGEALTIDARGLTNLNVPSSAVHDVATDQPINPAGTFTLTDNGNTSITNGLTIFGGAGSNDIELGHTTSVVSIDLTNSTAANTQYHTVSGISFNGSPLIGTLAVDNVVHLGSGASTVTTGNNNSYIAVDGLGMNGDAAAGVGNSNIIVGNGNNIVSVGGALASTNDTVTIGTGNNQIAEHSSGIGSSLTVTSAGESTGMNWIDSSALSNTITLGDSNNFIHTSAGNDLITVGNGNNWIDAGAGGNTITVGNGNNWIDSGDGGSTITVGNGSNVIYSGVGADTINLGVAGPSHAQDTIVYTSNADSSGTALDTINNFTVGRGGDVIDLSRVVAAAEVAAGHALTAQFLGSFDNFVDASFALASAAANQVSVVYDNADHRLIVDYNHNGVVDSGDMSIKLIGTTNLTADNVQFHTPV